MSDSVAFLPCVAPGTYTTSSLSTKTTTASDPPNICKVKPQQLQGVGLSSAASSFSQLGCVPPLLAQQTPQVYVSQSAAGELHTGLVWLLCYGSFIQCFPQTR